MSKKIIDVNVVFDKDEDDWDYKGMLQVTPVYGEVKKKEAVKQPKYGTKEYWDWYYKQGPGSRAVGNRCLFKGHEFQEASCCAFFVLGDWYSNEKDLTSFVRKLIVPKLTAVMKERGKYYSTYIPNTGEYKNLKTTLLEAGFQEGMQQPSSHGKYTVSRLEWIPSGDRLEEIVRSLAA